LRIALSVKTAVLMIAGEDGGGGLLPLLLPPRECDIASSARAVSAIRGVERK
jgi:hypothetical protein